MVKNEQATKPRGKTSKSSLVNEDMSDSLFDDKIPVRGTVARSRQLNRSSATDNIFSMLAEEVKRDGADSEDSDVSAADPNDFLKNMEDIDGMEADLFSSHKMLSSAPAKIKLHGNEGPEKDAAVLERAHAKPTGADEPARVGAKTNSAPSSTVRSYKKFNFSDGDGESLGQTPHTKDSDDPLADLDGFLPDKTTPASKNKPPKPEKSALSPSPSPILKKETNKEAKRGEFTFEDDKDDLMDALGFDSDKNNPKKKEAPLWSSKERSDAPQRARTRIDEILEGFTSPQLSERPPTGERKEQEKTSAVKKPHLEDDLTFGSYQPTVGSTPEGRQSRRQSVRFSTEDVSASSPENIPKPSNVAPLRRGDSADWLGLKTKVEPDYLNDDSTEKKNPVESLKTQSPPSLEGKPSFSGAKVAGDTAPTPTNQTNSEVSNIQRKDEEGDSWLAGVLSRKKALTASNKEVNLSKLEESRTDVESPASKPVTSTSRRKEDTFLTVKETSDISFGEPGPAAIFTALSEGTIKQDATHTSHIAPLPSPSVVDKYAPTPQASTFTSSSPAPPHDKVDMGRTLGLSYSSEPDQVTAVSISHPKPQLQTNPPLFASHNGSGSLREPSQADGTEPQPSLPGSFSTILPVPRRSQTESASAAVQQQTQLSGLGGDADTGVLKTHKHKDPPLGDYQSLQARIIQLEGQVKTLQLEKEQSEVMLENIQQHHKQDMELMENTHKARVKLLEDLASQRETRARLECEALMERLSAATRSAEQERFELQAQYQRKLDQVQQDRDREVERLRDLQRKSISEMKKDHEDQIQRLRRMKEEEIDAVTSAASQSRSLAGVVEQMEQFSSRLGALSSRVESTHEHTAQGLEQGARHRDEQLKMMEERLAQQQKAMTDERAYLKEIISRMDTQLNEQQRQLEKERWKMTTELAKAESTRRGLEEERHALSMQMSTERKELERAKSALLEEQNSVMQHCADERRKLADEWAHFHAQEKQRHERAEREASSLLERREGSIISLAQERADLKLRTAELQQTEQLVAKERETLQRLREELDREKERMSSTALRLKTRAQEVEAFSKLAAEKYEEGGRAMEEAKRVEASHEARLRNIQNRTEQLRLQEQRVIRERMRFNQVQNSESLQENPSVPLSPSILPVLPESKSVFTQSGMAPALNLPSSHTSVPNSRSMALQASLALWRYTAEKDRELLQEEQIYLESLKKKPYKSLENKE